MQETGTAPLDIQSGDGAAATKSVDGGELVESDDVDALAGSGDQELVANDHELASKEAPEAAPMWLAAAAPRGEKEAASDEIGAAASDGAAAALQVRVPCCVDASTCRQFRDQRSFVLVAESTIVPTFYLQHASLSEITWLLLRCADARVQNLVRTL